MYINSFSELSLTRILLTFCRSLFTLLIVSYTSQQLFNIIPHVISLGLFPSCATRVLFRKFLPIPLVYQFRCFKFLLRFLIHSEFIFVQGERYGSNFILQHMYSFSALLLKRLSFSNVYVFNSFVKNWVAIAM